MYSAVTMHQGADVVVLGEEGAAVRRCFRQQRFVTWIYGALRRIDNVVACGAQRPHRRCDNIGVREQPHLFGGETGDLIRQPGRIEQAGVDIVGL